MGMPGANAPGVGGGRLKLPRPSAARPAGSQAVKCDYSCDRQTALNHSCFSRAGFRATFRTYWDLNFTEESCMVFLVATKGGPIKGGKLFEVSGKTNHKLMMENR